MSNIETTLKKQPGFVAYLTAGDGGIARTKDALLALVKGGATVLEIGLPFSDPVADGPIIEAAAKRALKAGTRMDDVLQLVRDVRLKTEVPIILFSYYNPILQSGSDFLRRAAEAGVNGCLVVDLPIEEADAYRAQCAEVNIDPVFLIAPSTPLDRVKIIASYSKGMLYYVCRLGTTGMKDALPEDVSARIQAIKSVSDLPVVVGFGISNPSMVRTALQCADGFVVGSYFVNAVASGKTPEEITALAQNLYTYDT